MKAKALPESPRHTVRVRVSPRSPRESVEPGPGGSLHVRVKAAPVDGAANEAVLQLLARHLGVAPSQLRIVSGYRSRHKLVAVLKPSNG